MLARLEPGHSVAGNCRISFASSDLFGRSPAGDAGPASGERSQFPIHVVEPSEESPMPPRAFHVAGHPAPGEDRRPSSRGEPGHGGDRADAPRRAALPPCHADVSLGAAAHQHARHAARVREGIRRGIRRPAGVEEAPRRQDARDHAELGRDLCDELRRSRQGRPARVRRPAHAAGHPAGFLAAADPGRWRPVRGRRRLLRAGSGEGREVPAPAAGLRGRSPGRLLRLPLGHEQRVRVPPGLLCRCEQPEAAGRADREDEDLPAEGRGQADEVPGRFGRSGRTCSRSATRRPSTS